MHNKYTKDGNFVAISVSLDDPEDAKHMKNVREFLKEQKATFPNYVLNEASEVWQQKFDIFGPPVVFVFDKDGKAAKKFDAEVNYKEIEKVVVELMKK